MKRSLSIAAAAALFTLALAGTSQAADAMADTYGNTVVATDASGAAVKYFFNADKTWTATLPDKSTAKGTWTSDDKQICVIVAEPAAMANGGKPNCSPLEAHKVGDSWSSTNSAGQTAKITIVAGRS
jgi:hypothetical protein